jgi:hypothetical protein
MFYNKKLLFFIVTYLMSLILFYFIDEYLALTNIFSGFILGSFILYALVILLCFVMSFICLILFKYSRELIYSIFKLHRKALLGKFFWNTFTGFTYALILIIFLKVTEY